MRTLKLSVARSKLLLQLCDARLVLRALRSKRCGAAIATSCGSVHALQRSYAPLQRLHANDMYVMYIM